MPVKKAELYCLRLMGGLSSFSPSDSTTYYTGSYAANFNTTQGLHRLFIPKTGILTIADVAFYCSGDVSSNEAWVVSIRLNNSTDYQIASVANTDRAKRWFNDAMNIPVTKDDYIEIKTTTPAWATNPTGVIAYGHVIISC